MTINDQTPLSREAQKFREALAEERGRIGRETGLDPLKDPEAVLVIAAHLFDQHVEEMRRQRDYYIAEHDRLWEGNIEDIEQIETIKEDLAAISIAKTNAEGERDLLRADLERVAKERDAAIADAERLRKREEVDAYVAEHESTKREASALRAKLEACEEVLRLEARRKCADCNAGDRAGSGTSPARPGKSHPEEWWHDTGPYQSHCRAESIWDILTPSPTPTKEEQ